MKSHLLFLLFLTAALGLQAQELTQTVRGNIIDKESRQPLMGAAVILLNSQPLKGATSDAQGKFRLEEVPVGRQEIVVKYLGYHDAHINNLLVNSGKEVVITIELVEMVLNNTREVVITADKPKDKPNNEMAVVSARMFTVDETMRYAGSLGDPARMAASFAGVSGSNDARNDIVIRGNSPSGLLWRLEGVDIPNPNHFASQGTTGGPVSMLNSNLLRNSDFLTSAFPAEYGNAVSGAFDLKLRNGNSEKYEFMGQMGFNGFETLAEGPISRKAGSSFLASYRYSVLGVFQALGINLGPAGVPRYQDLSFKLNLPTVKSGIFEVFGLGGISRIDILDSKRDADDFTYGQQKRDIYFGSRLGVVGVSHTLMLGKKAYIKNILSASYDDHTTDVDSLDQKNDAHRLYKENSGFLRTALHTVYNIKINAANTFKAGAIITRMGFDLHNSYHSAWDQRWVDLLKSDGNTWLIQAYTQWKHDFSSRLTLLSGLHTQYLALNNTYSIEPRGGLRYQLDPKSSLNFGYGLHGQIQPLFIYLTETPVNNYAGYVQTNRDLNFTKSHHAVIGYDRRLKEDLRIKVETYYQYLYNIPVTHYPSSFALVNQGANFDVAFVDSLVSDGLGRNYGAELTLEKFFSKGYYYLLTVSVFDSRYKGSDGVWRNTVFNSNYTANMLAGREFYLGRDNNNIITFSGKATYAGGRRFTPLDHAASAAAKEPIYIQELTYASQFRPYFKLDAKLGFKQNKKKFTQEWALDVQNVTNQKNILTEIYDAEQNKVRREYQLGIFPMMLYRIQF